MDNKYIFVLQKLLRGFVDIFLHLMDVTVVMIVPIFIFKKVHVGGKGLNSLSSPQKLFRTNILTIHEGIGVLLMFLCVFCFVVVVLFCF